MHQKDVERGLHVPVQRPLKSVINPVPFILERPSSHARQENLHSRPARQSQDGGHRQRRLVLRVQHCTRKRLPICLFRLERVVCHRKRRAQHLCNTLAWISQVVGLVALANAR
eukprot:232369-Rhodomonas_salina.2